MLDHQFNSSSKVRGTAIVLFLLEIGIMFAYGFGSSFNTPASAGSDNSDSFIQYMLLAIFAIIGWGLIISYAQNSAIAGLTTTLIVVAISVQLQPLLYTFWKYAFAKTWSGVFALSYDSLAISMIMIVSLMVVFCCLAGRVGIAQIIVITLFYNIGWPLCFGLMKYLWTNQWAGQLKQVFDDNGLAVIYLFSGVFAIVVSLFLNGKPGANQSLNGSRHSAYIGLIGTGFVFATFPATAVIVQFVATPTAIRVYEAVLNTYFTLTASVIATYFSSLLFGDSKFGLRETLIGVISGGVIIGAVAGTINNIGGCITVGVVAGFVSGLWLKVVHPKINAVKTYDHVGIIGPVVINAALGIFFIAPILYNVYLNAGYTPTTMSKLTTNRASTFQLAIGGIALCIGIGMGLITGLICYLTRDPASDFHFSKVTSNDFGLYKEEQAPAYSAYNEPAHNTNAQLRQHPL